MAFYQFPQGRNILTLSMQRCKESKPVLESQTPKGWSLRRPGNFAHWSAIYR